MRILCTLLVTTFLFSSLNLVAQWQANQSSPIKPGGIGWWNLQVLAEDTVFFEADNNNGGHGLYRTVDNGQNWQNIYSSYLDECYFHDFKYGIIREQSNVYFTSDAAQSWQQILNHNQSVFAATISADSLIYCALRGQNFGSPKNVYLIKSNDLGQSWDTLYLPENNSNPIGSVNQLIPFGNDSIAVLANTSQSHYIYQSSNSGLNWDSSRLNIGNYNLYGNKFKYLNDSTFFLIGGYPDTVFRTTNRGASFQSVFTNGQYISAIDVDGKFVAIACSTNTKDSTILIARSNDLLNSYSYDTIRNYAQDSSSGIGSIDIIGGNYGWAGSYENLYRLDQCDINANYTVQNNGGGNYSFTNTTNGNFTESYWAFGDGTNARVTDTNHTFKANRDFVVVLAVNNSSIFGDCYDYFIDTVSVSGVSSPVQCQAGFVVYPSKSNQNITIVNSSIGSNLSFSWDFGDGFNSNSAAPTHIYSGNGPYNLCLTVNDGSGCINTYCDTIQKKGVRFNKAPGFTINVLDNATSISENRKLEVEFSIFPNPAVDQLFLKGIKNFQDLEIRRLDGKLINEVEIISNKIDVSHLKEGVYFLKLKIDGKILMKRFVLSK